MRSKIVWIGISSLCVLSSLGLAQVDVRHARSHAMDPTTFGPNVSVYRLGAAEFSPISTGTTYDDQFRSGGVIMSRFSTVPDGRFIANPHLPGGALVTGIELDYCNATVPNGVVLELYVANFDGTSPFLLATAVGDQGIPCVSSMAAVTPPFRVDNVNTTLVLSARTMAGDATTSLSGAALQYELQVSEPVGQTFLDVPPSNPYYQFIEAFAAAGVTAGCGDQNYCPNAFVTRGQVAVFFAKMLGLQWP